MNSYADLFIERARQKIGTEPGQITQEEVAKRLGLAGNSGVSKVLNGARGAPTLSTVEKWEEVLGYKPGEMLSTQPTSYEDIQMRKRLAVFILECDPISLSTLSSIITPFIEAKQGKASTG